MNTSAGRPASRTPTGTRPAETFTVTTVTCLHVTKRPLLDWIFAIYSVMTGRKDISALQLSKDLGVQYRTAWHMLHRIREAGGGGEYQLYTTVEGDETYVGGRKGNKHASKKLNQGRGTVGKTPVADVRERSGRVKVKPFTHTDAATLVGSWRSMSRPARSSTRTRRRPTRPCPSPSRTRR